MQIQLSIANITSLSISTCCFISSKSQQAVLSLSMAIGNSSHSQIYHPLALNIICETPSGHSTLAKPTTQIPNTHTSLYLITKAPKWFHGYVNSTHQVRLYLLDDLHPSGPITSHPYKASSLYKGLTKLPL